METRWNKISDWLDAHPIRAIASLLIVVFLASLGQSPRSFLEEMRVQAKRTQIELKFEEIERHIDEVADIGGYEAVLQACRSYTTDDKGTGFLCRFEVGLRDADIRLFFLYLEEWQQVEGVNEGVLDFVSSPTPKPNSSSVLDELKV